MTAPKARTPEDRLTEGLIRRGLRTDLDVDPVTTALFHLELQASRIRLLECRSDDFKLATALIADLAVRGVSFEDMPIERAVVHELDRLTARVIELETRERRGHLRLVT